MPLKPARVLSDGRRNRASNPVWIASQYLMGSTPGGYGVVCWDRKASVASTSVRDRCDQIVPMFRGTPRKNQENRDSPYADRRGTIGCRSTGYDLSGFPVSHSSFGNPSSSISIQRTAISLRPLLHKALRLSYPSATTVPRLSGVANEQ